MKIFNQDMLRLAREQAGQLQTALQKEFHVSQARWSKIETGMISPSEELLNQFVAYFNYPREFFFQDSLPFVSGMIFHRKKSSLGAKVRSQIEAEVRLRVFDIAHLYRHDGLISDILPRNGRSPEEMAQAVRLHWNLGDTPIENLVSISWSCITLRC